MYKLYILIYKWNEWQHDWREELELFCYYKVCTTCEQYSVIWKWTWISCKCILQALGKPLRKVLKKYKWYTNKGEKIESYKVLN